MGTRNLTVVIYKEEVKVAQYGQWDGYPSGQGAIIVDFLHNTDIEHFKTKLDQVKFFDDAKEKELAEYLISIGCPDGAMNMTQSAQFYQDWPYLGRDIGATILSSIDHTDDFTPIWLRDHYSFAADSLFCEWAYVLDLDKNVLEVYMGFNQQPLDTNERFAKLEKKAEDEYYPVKLLKVFNLDTLPEVKEFISECTVEEELVNN